MYDGTKSEMTPKKTAVSLPKQVAHSDPKAVIYKCVNNCFFYLSCPIIGTWHLGHNILLRNEHIQWKKTNTFVLKKRVILLMFVLKKTKL